MSGILDGVGQEVLLAFANAGLMPTEIYRSGNHAYNWELGRLAQRDWNAAVALVSSVLSRAFGTIRRNAQEAVDSRRIIPSKHRGRLRQCPSLPLVGNPSQQATPRADATALERTIVGLKTCDPDYEWFNQLSVATAFCSAMADRHLAVSIVRRPREYPTRLEFVDIEGWESTTSPFDAALTVYLYFCVVCLLAQAGLDGENPNWPEFEHVELCLAAPDTWYQRFDGGLASHSMGGSEAILQLFREALLDREDQFISHAVTVSYRRTGIRFVGLSQEQFAAHFLATPGQAFIQPRELPVSSFALMSRWIDQAFQKTGPWHRLCRLPA